MKAEFYKTKLIAVLCFLFLGQDLFCQDRIFIEPNMSVKLDSSQFSDNYSQSSLSKSTTLFTSKDTTERLMVFYAEGHAENSYQNGKNDNLWTKTPRFKEIESEEYSKHGFYGVVSKALLKQFDQKMLIYDVQKLNTQFIYFINSNLSNLSDTTTYNNKFDAILNSYEVHDSQELQKLSQSIIEKTTIEVIQIENKNAYYYSIGDSNEILKTYNKDTLDVDFPLDISHHTFRAELKYQSDYDFEIKQIKIGSSNPYLIFEINDTSEMIFTARHLEKGMIKEKGKLIVESFIGKTHEIPFEFEYLNEY